jgi:hypothetical protein
MTMFQPAPTPAHRAVIDEPAPGDDQATSPARPRAVVPLTGLARSPIQRRVSVRGRPGPGGLTLENPAPTTLDADAEKLITAVDAKTAQAWGQVVSQPLFTQLSALANSDGHIQLWVDGVRELMSSGRYPGLAAAEFGYAVESLCTHLLGASAEGWALEYQVAAGRTRPDIVARKGGQTMWLDLTAGSPGSHGHIYASKNWHFPNVCPYPHAEITYNVLDLGVQQVIAKNAALEHSGKPVATDVDPAALNAEVAAAQKLLADRLANWRARFVEVIRQEVRTVGKYGTIVADPDASARAGFLRWLNTTFETELSPDVTTDLRTAGSVLVALGMTPKWFGFVTTSASLAAGVAFLQSNDPHLLQPTT